MATCAHCKTQETELYENGTPICLACATDKAADRAAATNGTSHNPDRETGILQEMLRAVSSRKT